MKVSMNLAVDFYDPERASIRLETLVSDQDEVFGEILVFVHFALRQMYSLDRCEVTEKLATMLAVTGVATRQLASGIELIPYPGTQGGKRFACQLRLKEKQLRFDMQAKGFGMLARGVGYYSPVAVFALLKFLVRRRSGDDQYLNILAEAARLCGTAYLMDKITLTNQGSLAMMISSGTTSKYSTGEKTSDPNEGTDSQQSEATKSPQTNETNAEHQGLTRWLPCPECSGEIGVPEDWQGQTVNCPNCGVLVETVDLDSNVSGTERDNAVPHSTTEEMIDSSEDEPEDEESEDEPEPEDEPEDEDEDDSDILDDSCDDDDWKQINPELVAAVTPTRSVRESSVVNGHQTNGYAIAGLCLGIASIFLAFIGIVPVLAIIFSGIGLAKVKDRHGKGQVQAWIGLVLGILYTLVYMSLYGHI